MNLFNKTIGAFIILLSLFFVTAGFLPTKQIIKAEISIKKAQEDVFNQVNIIKNRKHWSPFVNEGNEFKLSILKSQFPSQISNEILIMSNKNIKSNWKFSHKANKTNVSWEIEFEELSYPFERVMGLVVKLKFQNTMNTGLKKLKQYLES